MPEAGDPAEGPQPGADLPGAGEHGSVHRQSAGLRPESGGNGRGERCDLRHHALDQRELSRRVHDPARCGRAAGDPQRRVQPLSGRNPGQRPVGALPQQRRQLWGDQRHPAGLLPVPAQKQRFVQLLRREQRKLQQSDAGCAGHRGAGGEPRRLPDHRSQRLRRGHRSRRNR